MGLRDRLRLSGSGRGGGSLAGAPPRSRHLSTSASVVLGLPYRLSPIEGAGSVLYTWVPQELAALRPAGSVLSVYSWLDMRAAKRGFWFDREQDIADGTGLGLRSVQRAIAFLRKHEFIATEPAPTNRTSYKYVILHRQNGRHRTPEMAARPAKIGGNSAITPYMDLRDHQQSSPRESPSPRMNHGDYQFIFDQQRKEQERYS